MAHATHIAILGSAPYGDPATVARLCVGADLIVCADGGADAAVQARLPVALVVGDMDSISEAAYVQLRAAGTQFVQHPRDKDKTDLELAIDCALERSPQRLTLVGALGGRLDHSLGNVLLLALPALTSIDARLVDASAEALVVWSERRIEGQPGEYVSLLPLTPRVEGITTDGLLYALQDDVLIQGFTRGVSNELIALQATVRVRSGCLLLIHQTQERSHV